MTRFVVTVSDLEPLPEDAPIPTPGVLPWEEE